MTNPDETTIRRTMAAEILDRLDDGDIPGSPIRWQGHEIWVHTTGQVEGWLRTWLEREAITSADDAERIVELQDRVSDLSARLADADAERARRRTEQERSKAANEDLGEIIVRLTELMREAFRHGATDPFEALHMLGNSLAEMLTADDENADEHNVAFRALEERRKADAALKADHERLIAQRNAVIDLTSQEQADAAADVQAGGPPEQLDDLTVPVHDLLIAIGVLNPDNGGPEHG
ncbi:hypothetical protein E1287_25780 [Actinomadura sp. KC06]|uniref:hypothetical protein n=1 Tax=Actinomadura sp. KC06 TaxID=2530369 RepID=UPI001042F730|nr:hypothetical protein [Actinomadura sp. KC06]TDD31674.1 hypothetical protein E1287_25780 [Actinomadura sp. KC06]